MASMQHKTPAKPLRRPPNKLLMPAGFMVMALMAGKHVSAQPQDEPLEQDEQAERAAAELLNPLGETFSGFDWDAEHPNIQRSITNIWSNNDWNDEADLFARDVATEVTAIPPWQMADRLELMTKRVAARYDFTPEQRSRFQAALLREAGGFLLRHATDLLAYSQEAVETRANGQPFSAEQVARWAKEYRPVMDDVRVTIERFIGRMEPDLTPRQRKLLQRDHASYEKRRRTIDEAMGEWAKGKWEPAQWGLEDDPIQTGKRESQKPDDPSRRIKPLQDRTQKNRAKVVIPKWVDYDPTTWFAYVLEVEKRYRLDAGQMGTAESIHAELLERASAYQTSHAAELAAVAPAQRAKAEAYERVRDIFRELQARLDAIPTTSQRDEGNRGVSDPRTSPPRPSSQD